MARQLKMKFRTWGGARKGAGRKPKGQEIAANRKRTIAEFAVRDRLRAVYQRRLVRPQHRGFLQERKGIHGRYISRPMVRTKRKDEGSPIRGPPV